MLQIIKELGRIKKEKGDYKEYVVVLCSCGKEKVMRKQSYLISKSCGCYAKEVASIKNSTHKMSNTRIYKIWSGMKSRCYNKKLREYKDYGGRGITVSEDWLKFENFYRDMGETYSSNATIERIDNNKGYSKENCKWATRKEQQRNRRSSHIISFNNQEKTVTDWALELNINYATLIKRIKKYGVNKHTMRKGSYHTKNKLKKYFKNESERDDTMQAMEEEYKILLGVK